MSKPKFSYWRAKDGQWYWHLKAANGEIISQGEGYKTRQGVLAGISANRTAITTAQVGRIEIPLRLSKDNQKRLKGLDTQQTIQIQPIPFSILKPEIKRMIKAGFFRKPKTKK